MNKSKLTQRVREELTNVSVESWSEKNVSTEGIGDIFKKIKGTIREWNNNRIRSRKKPDPLRHKNIQMSWYWIAREIKKTYLNPIWLDSQVSAEGPIDASGFLPGLTFDNYVTNDASLVLSAANQIRKAVSTFIPARDSYILAFKREVLDPLAMGQFNTIVFNTVDTKKLTQAVEVFFKSHGTVLDLVSRCFGKITISLPENSTLKNSQKGFQFIRGSVKRDLDATLPALTKEQIAAAASVLIQAINAVPEVYLQTDSLVLNIVDDYVLELESEDEDGNIEKEYVVRTSLELKRAFALVRNDQLRILLDEMSWNDNLYVPVIEAFDLLVKGLIASESYMASSLK